MGELLYCEEEEEGNKGLFPHHNKDLIWQNNTTRTTYPPSPSSSEMSYENASQSPPSLASQQDEELQHPASPVKSETESDHLPQHPQIGLAPPMPPLCAGCSLRITDSEYLTAGPNSRFDPISSWCFHPNCLRCAECRADLTRERAFLAGSEAAGGLRCSRHSGAEPWRCFGCQEPIAKPESEVIRSPNGRIFHVDCFRCAVCAVPLRNCGKYALGREGLLVCPEHTNLDRQQHQQHDYQQQQQHFYPPPPHHHLHPPVMGPMPSPPFPPPPQGMPPFGGFPPHPNMDPHWYGGPGGPPPPGSGGGEFPLPPGGEFSYDNNNEPVKKKRGRKKRKVPEAFAPLNGFLEGAYPPGGLDANGQSKVKRARTSFKHHQLRIMKAHFQINQNPDSRELKMLSQKTGLDKKVLQVWFQNARAKWRRTKAQDGTEGSATVPGGPSSSGSGGDPMSFMDAASMSAAAAAAAQGEASPSSDECSGPMIQCY